MKATTSPRPTAPRAGKHLSFSDYRRWVRSHYDGLPGALTAVTGVINGHELLAGRLFSPKAFDVRGCKRLLDAACGNGRYTRCLLHRADPDATITAFDLSPGMLKRARKRVASPRVTFAAADLTRLPYAEATFDAVVCGWVLEHLSDPRDGLRELARVLQPKGKLLLLATEQTSLGWVCAKLWNCRMYGRAEMRRACEDSGLVWHRELWFTPAHQLFKMGGVVVELRKE